MNLKPAHIVIALLLGFFTISLAPKLETNIPTTENTLDLIFESEKIKITVINYGGFTGGEMGRSNLILKRKSQSEYIATYEDALYLDNAKFKVDVSKLKALKTIFVNLIKTHQPDKTPQGSCTFIDKNYIIKSGKHVMEIKPANTVESNSSFTNWVVLAQN